MPDRLRGHAPDPPGGPDAEADRIAVAFARLLRGAGLDVPVGRAVTFAQALALTGVDRSGPVWWYRIDPN